MTTPATPTQDPLAAAIARIEAAAQRAEEAAAKAEAAIASRPQPTQNSDGSINVNSVTCPVCNHVGAPMPDGLCPNNNCPTRQG